MGGYLLRAEDLPLGSSLLHSSVPRCPQEQLEYSKTGWHSAPSQPELLGISLTLLAPPRQNPTAHFLHVGEAA